MSRRSLVVGTAALLLSTLPEAAISTAGSGDVVASAAFRGRDSRWQITLTDKYAAKYSAQLSGIAAGSLWGDFRFYDTEFADKTRVQRFLQLPRSMSSPSPSIHPNTYEIAVKNVTTGAFHEVVVLFNSDIPPSENLILFFSVWRNIWSGVPGYPRAPEQYAG